MLTTLFRMGSVLQASARLWFNEATTMTITATKPLECYAIKVQQRDGTERVLYNVASKQVAMQIVDELNRNHWEIAWYEQRSSIGVK